MQRAFATNSIGDEMTAEKKRGHAGKDVASNSMPVESTFNTNDSSQSYKPPSQQSGVGRLLKFALGPTAESKKVKNVELRWDDFARRFEPESIVVGEETHEQYLNSPTATQLKLKDVGYFVPAHFENNVRKKHNVVERDCITLDLDHAPVGAYDRILDDFGGLGQYAFVLHTTRKHKDDKPRYRLIMPLMRPVSEMEYLAISRWLAAYIYTGNDTNSIEWFDDTCFEFTRVMFWPSRSKDQTYDFVKHDGQWVNPDEILAQYADPRDLSAWPVSSRMKTKLRESREKAGDPLTKGGIVGAFCRKFDIYSAIEKFLPDVYSAGSAENRLTYAAGTSANGAVIYDNGLFLFSHHESDPGYYQNLNAFDLVRVHLYAEMDSRAAPGTPVNALPSYRAMAALAMEDEDVAVELSEARRSKLEDGFNDFDDASNLSEAKAEEHSRPCIKLVDGELPTAASHALEAIRQRGELFEHGTGSVVRVAQGRLIPMNSVGLQDYLGQICVFERFDQRKKSWALKDTPRLVADFILERHGKRQLPAIQAIITAPILRLDGSLLSEEGYDASTGMYFQPERAPSVAIPSEPTIEQAKAALETLWLPYREFDFVDDTARGVMLAAILTAALRPALPTAPAFAFDAPTIGSGKTLLARTLAAIAGVPFEAKAPADSDEETRKFLFASLRVGARIICLDNITKPIDGRASPALCSFLTSSIFSDRVLGVSEIASLPNRTLLTLTGNNLRFSADLVRRILVARIDARTETPYGRKFAVDPESLIRKHREQYIEAALTLVRSAITLGDSFNTSGLGAPLSGSTASYEAWDRLVRQTVGWVGESLDRRFGDPTAGIATAVAVDPHRDVLRRVLLAWHSSFKSRAVTCAEAWQRARNGDDFEHTGESTAELREAIGLLSEGDVRFNTQRLGKWLQQHREEIADGLRFERRDDKHAKVAAWQVIRITGAGDEGSCGEGLTGCEQNGSP